MTIGVTIHDGMFDLRLNGVDGGHWSHELGARFWKIYHQEGINDLKLGGTVEFEFEGCYKTQRASQWTTLGHLVIEHLSKALSIESQAKIETLSSWKTTYNLEMMTTTKDGLGIEEVIASDVAQTQMV